MRVAVTGACGQLGWELCRQLGPLAVPLTRRELDLTDKAGIASAISLLHPDILINCAAYTQVDRAEDEPALCRCVNSDAVQHLSDCCHDVSCRLIQVSTDFVFGGQGRPGGYREGDAVDPSGTYAQTKQIGETFATKYPQNLVVRTCGLYSHTPDRTNFVRTIRRLGRERPSLGVVNDQRCTPTYVPHLARAIVFLVSHPAQGIVHIVNGGSCTWFEFARQIACHEGLSVEVQPISTLEFGARAPRPADSVLNTDLYHSLGGPRMPTWEEALREYFSQETALAQALS